MWIGDTIYFNSDRDGHFNLYSYNVSSARTNQVTRSKLWTFGWPSSDHDAASSMKWMVNCRSWIPKAVRAARISITVPDDGLRAAQAAFRPPAISNLTS